MGRHPEPIEPRFWAKVKKTESCWLWIGYRSRRGYGSIRGRPEIKGMQQAHRASWEINRGPIPKGMHVLHRCDNTSCVNPDHLFLGTHGDNMRDMFAKGRCCHAGMNNSHSKFNHERLRELRHLRQQGWTQNRLASHFDVTSRTIWNILHGRGYGDFDAAIAAAKK